MKKKYFLVAGIIWIVLAGFGLYFYNKPHTSAASMSADIRIDAGDLYDQYQKDEAAGNKKFLDKIVEVKGRVADTHQEGNATNIQLESGNPAGGINCSIYNGGDKIQLPAKGSTVTVKGKCSGFLVDVNLVDCVIEQ